MKKELALEFLVIFLSAGILSAAQDVTVSSNSAISNRAIIKGDTLWDISKQVYGDPYLWPSLWEVNKSTITNPHLIYVGQSIVLPPKEDIKKIKPSSAIPVLSMVKKASPSDIAPKIVLKEKTAISPDTSKTTTVSQAPTQEENAEISRQQVEVVKEELGTTVEEKSISETSSLVPSSDEKNSSKKNTDKLQPTISAGSASSPLATYPAKIVGANYTPDGVIVGMKEEKLLTSQGDVVYASIPFAKVSPGDRFGIYRRTGKKIYNPSDGRYLGDELVKIGTAGVENVTANDGVSAILRILMSREPVEKKDWLILER